MAHSRIAGFFRLSLQERRERILSTLGLPVDRDEPDAVGPEGVWDSGGIDCDRADQIVENVLGIYALPFGVALNAVINEKDRLIPFVVEEPSVIAAASNACKMIRAGGGFRAEMTEALMIGQVELRDVGDVELACQSLLQQKPSILEAASDSLSGLVRRGGGPRELEVRQIGPHHLVVHLLIDCCDAMGANLVNTAVEAVGPLIAQVAQADLGLRILSNLADRRMVRVSARVPGRVLLSSNEEAENARRVVQEIEAASLFAERDAYRAATHNKGIMNGVDSVVIATGNDYRAVEAGAHAYAARCGAYRPLATWKSEGETLVGELVMPLALGIVGGTLRVHPGARLGLALSEAKKADDLALLAGCAGLASNLAAIRALATEGIQRGHMSLHARSVAICAGAKAEEVNQVAAAIARQGQVTLERAKQALGNLRAAAGAAGGPGSNHGEQT